jgi:hypothetical protein
MARSNPPKTIPVSKPSKAPDWVIGTEPSKPRAHGSKPAGPARPGRSDSKPLPEPEWVRGRGPAPTPANGSPPSPHAQPGRDGASKPLPEPDWVTGGKH